MQWLAFADTLFAISPRGILNNVDEEAGIGPLANDIVGKFHEKLSTLEAHLERTEGQFMLSSGISAADCSIAYSLTLFTKRMQWDLSAYPHISAYLAHMSARPAFIRAWEFNNDDLRGPQREGAPKGGTRGSRL